MIDVTDSDTTAATGVQPMQGAPEADRSAADALEAASPYSDMLSLPYPRPSTRERMPLSERAKIFMPFAALKGFDELLAQQTR